MKKNLHRIFYQDLFFMENDSKSKGECQNFPLFENYLCLHEVFLSLSRVQNSGIRMNYG